ncbi:glycosyltransferase [Nonomuraea sp. NPDC049714]|uniref:glycosyltransferase n=1 Tax=Nonomuraea sp. NPDC049714 TaxID=3364357 RepID=UPI003790BC86
MTTLHEARGLTMHKRLPITILAGHLGHGGAEGVVVALAEGLSRMNFEVTILLRGRWIARAIPPGIEIVMLRGTSDRQRVRELQSMWHRRPPKIAISHLTEVNIQTLHARQRLAKDFPVVVVEHTMPSRLINDYTGGGWIYKRNLLRKVRKYYREADAVIALCESAAVDISELAHMPRNKVITINNPVIPSDIDQHMDEMSGHPWLDSTSGINVVLAAGRFAPEKNFEMLIRAFKKVHTARPDTRLVILGAGECGRNYERLADELGIAGYIAFPGHISNIYAFMSRASVFALPSIIEGVPNVLVEALACEIPIVATDSLGGNRELLMNGVYGTLIPLGDEDSFASAIISAIENRPTTEGYRERVKDFEVDSSINKYAQLISELTEKGNANAKST